MQEFVMKCMPEYESSATLPSRVTLERNSMQESIKVYEDKLLRKLGGYVTEFRICSKLPLSLHVTRQGSPDVNTCNPARVACG